MATRSLPNPAFGNDPATLLGSLIVEIGELGDLQKATTARIENLDENEDRSTTLIEDAIRDDLKEGIKRTDTLKDLKLGVGTLKTYTQKQVEDAEEKYKADVFFQEQSQKMMSQIGISDRIELEMRESLRNIANYFDKSNPDGITALGKSIVGGIDTFTQFDKGANQLSRGFNNLFDGMGALGPVVNAFKTGLNKAVAGFDVVVGLTRSVFGAVRGAGSFMKSLFTGDAFGGKPVNQVAKDLASGSAVLSDDEGVTEGQRGSEKNPMFIDFTRDSLDSLTDAFFNYGGGVVVEGEFEELKEQQQLEYKKDDKFRKASIEGIKEQRRYNRGIPRFAIYLGGFLLLIFALLTSLKLFFTDPARFFANSLGAGGGAARSIFNIRRVQDPLSDFNVKDGRTTVPKTADLDDINTLKKTDPAVKRPVPQPGKEMGFDRTVNIGGGAGGAESAKRNIFSLKRFLDVDSAPSGGLYKATIQDAIKGRLTTGAIVHDDGSITKLGRNMSLNERVRVLAVKGARALPRVLIGADVALTAADFGLARWELRALYDAQVPISRNGGEARPLSEEEFNDMILFINNKAQAQVLGTASGATLAYKQGKLGFDLIAKYGPKDPRGQFILQLANAGAAVYTGVTGDIIVTDLARFGLDAYDSMGMSPNSRFRDLSQIEIAPSALSQISGDEDLKGFNEFYIDYMIGGKVPLMSPGATIIDNSDNTAVSISGNPPANDSFLENSQTERSSYMQDNN